MLEHKFNNLELINFENDEYKELFWHSTSHLLAYALQEIYPDIKFGTGPATENGFYYDVDFGNISFTDKDFKKVEQRMLEIAKKGYQIIRKEISKKDAVKFFTQKQDPYKLEIIEGLENGNISFYEMGNFIDLCAGPHLPSTDFIKSVKITKIAGAYWRGNEKNKMLTRVYGISFPSKEQLQEYLFNLEEAKKRDHRKIGKDLDLFYFDEEVGMGLPLWAPKGEALRQNLIEFLKKLQRKAGYQHVASPHIGRKELYVTSGHYAKYGQDAYQPIKTPAENEEFFLKPMNCPHHCKLYAAKPKSYKELPVKYAEFGTVYRYEQHGELHGLTRVRGFTQDDAHIFCRPDQLKEEFLKVVDLVNEVYGKLGFSNFQTQISLRDTSSKEKYLGSDEMWDLAEKAIVEATQERGMITTTKEGEAAFYGPKLDFMVRDAIGRKWQIGTIQVDYMMPENFDLTYIGQDNQKHRPVMIHRALFGSMERFIALLIENTAGKFPVWLAPTKAIILPISDKYEEYASKIAVEIQNELEIIIDVDVRNEKIGKKIREAQLQKIPYMLIVGENEKNANSISVRKRDEMENKMYSIQEFIELLKSNIQQ
ncbi:MAG: threonine--tRNA ligase [Bacteroidota bacterium]